MEIYLQDEDKKKKKDRKIKLTMHDHQVFKDGDDVGLSESI